MRPLFRLSIGRPGSSFAIEIARKIGLPEEVISEVRETVGADYIDMDKYLQDVIRDKRYWESKRQSIRQEEKLLQEASSKYTEEMTRIAEERKRIIAEAKKEAQRLIQEAGGQIERTIREIREAEAAKDETRIIRQRLADYKEGLSAEEEAEALARAKKTQREVERLLARRQRHADRKARGRNPYLSSISPLRKLLLPPLPYPQHHSPKAVSCVSRDRKLLVRSSPSRDVRQRWLLES